MPVVWRDGAELFREQIAGAHFREDLVLDAAAVVEAASPGHLSDDFELRGHAPVAEARSVGLSRRVR